jgi:glucose-1-phosphate thymidylyltransferase
MLAGIKDILIISTPVDLPNFERLLKDGSQFGVNFSYQVQEKPNGLAQAFVLGEKFINGDDVCLILGDNIFYGNNFSSMLKDAAWNTAVNKRSTIFGKYVSDPERFGVAEFDESGKVISLEEKPKDPKSNYAVVGLYFYDSRVVEYAKALKPSARGEYEITDLNKIYLENEELDMKVFGRGFAWLDTGTMDSLAEATEYVKIVEEVQGVKISVPEEIAYYNKWINEEQLLNAAEDYGKSPYGDHLRNIAHGNVQTTYNKKKAEN